MYAPTASAHLLLGPVAGQAANEKLVGRVQDHLLDCVQRGEVHGGVRVWRAQHDAHVWLVVVGPPDLQRAEAHIST